MATSATPDASEVKRRGRQRLIGAIAIAILLVVFVPMILDKEPKPAKSGPSLDIPPQDKAAPLPPPTAKAVAPVAPAPSTPAPEASKPAPQPVAAVQPRLEGFAVQVGAFKDEAKLAQAREKLTAAKVSHYVERVDTSSGELKRLRAGPFPTREAADKALASIKSASLDGKVVPLP